MSKTLQRNWLTETYERLTAARMCKRIICQHRACSQFYSQEQCAAHYTWCFQFNGGHKTNSWGHKRVNLCLVLPLIIMNFLEAWGQSFEKDEIVSGLTGGCITSCVDMHTPCRQVPLGLQGVPSAQGKLPFLVEHWDVPSSWHHSWLQNSLSEVLGQWINSSPNICWHCWSRLYLVPGSSLGNGMELSGTSSRQSPVDTIRCTTAWGWLYWQLWRLWTLLCCVPHKCVFPCVWHDNIGKIFKPWCFRFSFLTILYIWMI